ncbi:MAG: TIGR02646 family protein [Caldilineaceae bacterium]|nr:TIGR02646 family protein [Caldilineaceae bacterium]
MKSIVKGSEPVSLLQHRQAQHSNFDNFEDKDLLREALVAEQRGLCCYCMGRIRPSSESMKIEHWRCQANYPDEQLRYRNLLGACKGGEGQRDRHQHCDTRKGNRDLRLNPAESAHQVEAHIRYAVDGSILGNDPEFDCQLNDVLNLNLPLLKQQRKSLLDGVLGWWKAERNRLKTSVPRDRLIRKRDKYMDGSGQLGPYSQVAVWWLNQRISR